MRRWAVRLGPGAPFSRKTKTMRSTITTSAFFLALIGCAHTEPTWAPESPAKWPERSLSVWISPDLGEHAEGAELALEAVNDAAGCKVLRRASARKQAQIEIDSGGCDESTHAGCAFYDPAEHRAILRIAHPGTVTQSYLIAQHELGHALGLADDGAVDAPQDPGEWRWMRPFVSAMTINVAEHGNRLEAGQLLPAFSTDDSDALRARYCN